MGRKKVSDTPPARPDLTGVNEEIRFKRMMGWRIETMRWHRWPDSTGPLADMFNVTTHSIRHWERGRNPPSCYELVRLAKIFGVTMDFFATGDARGLPQEKIEELVRIKLI